MTRYGTAPAGHQHYEHTSPTEMFGTAQPFSMHRRRKRGDALARWTTKAVLLSPLFILSVWSLVVMSSGTKKMNAITTMQQQQQMTTRGMKQQQQRRTHPRSSSNKNHKPPEVLMNAQQQQQTLVVQPPNLGQRNTVGVATMRQGNPIGSIMDRDGNMIPVYAAPQQQPLQAQLSVENNPLQASQEQSSMMNAQQLSSSNGGEAALGSILNAEGKLIPVYGPYGNAQDSNAMMNGNAMTSNAAPMKSPPQLSSTGLSDADVTSRSVNPLVSAQQVDSSARTSSGEQIPVVNPLGSTGQQVVVVDSNARTRTSGEQITVANPLGGGVMLKPREEPKKASTKILYYDSSKVYVDGKLYMPEIVYDEYGAEVNLTEIQAKSGAEVYLEPPSTQESQPNAQLSSPQRLQMSRSDLQVLASQPPAQDQYIIIATVAVMALLVGALSARRMRSRNFLSSCIENESLEDEIAYDVATTNGDYSTFAGNWQGADLEKFDV